MGENGGKRGEMGDGGKWGEMGGSYIKMGENGGNLEEFGGIGVFPIFPHFSFHCGAHWPPPTPTQPVRQKWFFGGFHTMFSPFFHINHKKSHPNPPFPISPHFPPFSLGCFRQCHPPPPHTALLLTKTLIFGLFNPKISHFSTKQSEFSHLPPFPPIFPTLAHFPDSVPLNVPKVGTSEPCRSLNGVLYAPRVQQGPHAPGHALCS